MKKLLLIILLPLQALAQNYPQIHTSRPRLILDSTRISWLQNHINQPGDCGATYNSFLYNYNNNWINDPQLYLEGSDTTAWDWDWGSQWATYEAIFTITHYKLSNQSIALARCRFIAQKLIDTVINSNISALQYFEKETFIRQMSEVGSLLLDWCYTDLPIALRQQLVQQLYVINAKLMTDFIYTPEGNNYNGGHNAYNCVFANRNVLALHEAAGLNSAQNDSLQYWYELVYDKWVNGLLPVYEYYRNDDGGWNWGGAYSFWALIDQYQFFDNMLIATGKNFYQEQTWVQNSINQYWHMVQPKRKVIHWGDGENTFSNDRVVYRHAAIFNDPRSAWLAQEYSQPQYLGWTVPIFDKLIYKNFEAPNITKPSLPKQWWSDKVGLSVSRSSWDSTATMVTFSCSPSKRNGHEHRDNNSFTIYRNAPLLIDAGNYDAYGSTHYQNYYTRTIAHNSICVHDVNEAYTDFGTNVSNDGGQVESGVLQGLNDIVLPEHQRGEWKKYIGNNQFTYHVADAALSYNPNKLDFFRRRLLYIPPERVIVLDHIHLTNPTLAPTDVKWVAHFVNKPDISGTITNTDVPNHIVTYDGNDIKAVNGNGNVAIRTLLPPNATTTLIGGTGYEYWVDGVNYEPEIAPDTNFNVPGKWRIEISPTSFSSDTVVFLHTINTGDNIQPAQPEASVLHNATSMVVDWKDTLFFFATNGALMQDEHHIVSVPGNRNIQIMAFDLTPGNYCIAIDSVNAQQYSVDAGVLQAIISLEPGMHTININSCPLAIRDKNMKGNSLSIYPNPAKKTVNIFLPVNVRFRESHYIINFYDEMGRCFRPTIISSKNNELTVDISNLSKGVYVIEINVDGEKYSSKVSIQ